MKQDEVVTNLIDKIITKRLFDNKLEDIAEAVKQYHAKTGTIHLPPTIFICFPDEAKDDGISMVMSDLTPVVNLSSEEEKFVALKGIGRQWFENTQNPVVAAFVVAGATMHKLPEGTNLSDKEVEDLTEKVSRGEVTDTDDVLMISGLSVNKMTNGIVFKDDDGLKEVVRIMATTADKTRLAIDQSMVETFYIGYVEAIKEARPEIFGIH